MVKGEEVKKLREEKGLSPIELAKIIKVPIDQLLDVEEGKKEASPRLLSKLIKVLDIEEQHINQWKQVTVGNIGDKIRALRKKSGYSLEDLSILSGLSLSYLGEIERGEKIVTFSALKSIVEVLGVPISLFVGNQRKQSIIGEKLRMARLLKNKTQKRLAEEIGVSTSMIAQLENGKVHASLDTLEKISDALGISVCYLILEQEEVENMIGAITPEMREILYNPKVQTIIGSICTFSKEEIILVLNFIDMIKNPSIRSNAGEER